MIEHEFFILKEIENACILGIYFLTLTQAVICFENPLRIAFYQGIVVLPILTSGDNSYKSIALLSKRSVIPPKNDALIQLTLRRNDTPHSVLSMIEALPFRDDQNLLCSNSLFVSNCKSAICKILNPNDCSITLPKHKTIGRIIDVDVDLTAALNQDEVEAMSESQT